MGEPHVAATTNLLFNVIEANNRWNNGRQTETGASLNTLSHVSLM